MPASAGTGTFFDSEEAIDIFVPECAEAEEAHFVLSVSGDSMEPIITDKSVVWVKKQENIDNGDVGIFVLNGESLCKKLNTENGKCYLMSYNSKYSPIEVLETDDLRVVGKVIL